MEYRFSVIIPVYNAEKTLCRCLDSLIDQKYERAEIILINDGSKDQSGKICREYAEKHSCVKYIEQENAGASAARNAGLNIASGEYITFVDSDDYVENTYFSELDKYDTDFVVFAHKVIRGENIVEYHFASGLMNAETNTDVIFEVLKNRLAGPCNKRFKKSIISRNKLSFHDDLIIGEDFIFGLEYMLACESSCVAPAHLYYVDETNTNSVTRGAKYDFSQFLLIYEYAFQIAQACKWEYADKQRLIQILDYLYCRTSFACMERCIATKLNSDITPIYLVSMFKEQLQADVEPMSAAHAVMRFCVKHRILAAYFAVAYMHLFLRQKRAERN